MITGVVNANREATIPLRLIGRDRQQQHVEAVVDTGFNGFLTLPPTLIASLGLKRLGRGRAILADGNESVFDIYAATIVWNGEPHTVETDATNTSPLVGMSLLDGHELEIQVVQGGSVTIQPLSER